MKLLPLLYLLGYMDESDEEQFETHLLECDDCLRLVERQARLLDGAFVRFTTKMLRPEDSRAAN